MFTISLNYIQLKYNSDYHTPFNFSQPCFGSHRENTNKLGMINARSEFETKMALYRQQHGPEINSNISHFCSWLPDVLLPLRILQYFCFRFLTSTRHCCTLLDYPPSAISWFTLSPGSFLLFIVFNSFCTTLRLKVLSPLHFV